METMKVSSSSIPSKVAGALTCLLREHPQVTIQVIGAASLNQAMKAIAIARGYMAPGGQEIYCVPSFYDLTIDHQTITSLRLNVEMHEKLF
ncbi:MAG: stage V sporulation protein S [Erysipelotrichaceae bacterium]|nr:stage V sporulation protein S [Erysipelotrichaceae bacterium]